MAKTTKGYLDWLSPNGVIDWLEKPAKIVLTTFLIVTAGIIGLGVVTLVTQRSGSQATGESLEAEDATISSGSIKTVIDASASQGKYVQFLPPAQKNPKDLTVTCYSGINPTAGVLATSVSVPVAGTYYIWSRVNSESNSENSYWLQVDAGCPYSVGGFTQSPTNSWIWVNYIGGNPDAKLSVNFTKGIHTLKFFGKGENLKLDRVILTSDKTCVPADLGNNCK